jgi:hypothetical protein
MPDSIYPANMPKGYGQYLAYVDGERSKDADAVRSMFAGARILTLTVLGGNAVADGCDMEPGDLSPASAAAWLHGRIRAGQVRPVLYASRDNVPGVLSAMAGLGVSRQQVRILSAHYDGEHVCSPRACGWMLTADGTQWSDSFPGVGGSRIDMSLLADDFFSTGSTSPTQLNWTETIVQQLPELRQGATGTAVRTVQGLCAARGHAVTVDGSFGPATLAAVKAAQAAGRVTQDGVVGPVTWGVLLGV